MKLYNRSVYRIKLSSVWTFALVLGLLALITHPAFTEETTPSPKKELHVTSDYLISDRNARYAEFQGNVVATQEGSVMTSERLKITFLETKEDETEARETETGNPRGSIESIVATGQVKMVMEDKTAWAEKAVFNSEEDTITLTGGNPRVVSGKSSMAGDKIVIKRSTGQVMAYRGQGQPVDVIIFEEDLDKHENNEK